MKKILLLALVSALWSSGGLYAQSNSVMDDYLSRPWADYDLTVYLIFSAAKLIPEDLPPQVAFETLKQKKWGYYSDEQRGKPVTMGDFSFMMMKALNLQGGIMFTLVPSPWYATKEFNFRRYMPSAKKPNEPLTPFEVVQSIATVLENNK